MTTIHIKASLDVDNALIATLMAILQQRGFKVEKYLGINHKIIMARGKFND